MKRGILIAVPVVLATLVAGLLIAPGFIDWSQYKTQVQDQIKTATGHTAEIRGDLSLAILPTPRVHISDVQVAAPPGSAHDYLIKLSRLDVNLALFPLLSGAIDFDTVSLVEPVIALEVFKDGRRNWMTPELEKLTAAGEAPAGKGPEIALKNIRIENGSFTYLDGSKGKAAPLAVEDINVTARADTLAGPFAVTGEVGYGGRTISLKVAAQAIEAGATSLPVTLDAEILPDGLDFRFAGAVDSAAPFAAQGETKLQVRSLKALTGAKDLALADDSLTLEGLLTAGPDKLALKNAAVAIGGNTFSGALEAGLSPLKITGDFKSADTLNLDKLIKPAAGKAAKPAGALLPETLVLPVGFDAGLKLSAPSLIYQEQVYNAVTVLLSKQDKIFAADIAAKSIPGKGSIDAKAAIKFAAKSVSRKDGSEVYSDPALVLTVKGDTQNIAQTAEALASGPMPFADAWKTADFNANIDAKPNTFTLRDTSLKLDDSHFTVSGSYTAGARPKMVADIAADRLDLDALQQKLGKKSEKQQSVEDSLRGLALPIDLDFDFGAQNARLQGHDVKGLRATGSFRQNAVSFSNLSAQDFAGAAFKASGGIGDLKNLSGIDVTVSGQAGDAKEIAKLAGYDIAALPQSLEKATVSLNAKGTVDALAVNADIAALNGNLTAKGDVAQPLGKMLLSNLAIQAKHRNLAEAIQAFFSNSPRYVSLEKPLDIYAEIDNRGTLYSFKNMKASLAGSPITGALSVDTGGDRSSLDADLAFNNLTIQSAGGAGGGAAPSGGAHWSSEPMDTSWMNAMNAEIKIRANRLVYEGWDLQKPVIDIALQNGNLDIRQFESGLFGGTMAVDGNLKAGAGNKGFGAVQTAAKFTDVSFESLVKAMTRGVSLVKGQGDITMNTRISTSGPSQAALVSALQGDGTVSGRSLVMEGFDLTRFAEALSDQSKPTDTLTGLWKGASRGGSTSFDTLDGAFTINQGQVDISRMDLTGPQANVATNGALNLPAWTIQTAHTITLVRQPDVPPFTIRMEGSLDNPAQTMGQGLLQDYLNRKLNKKIENVLSDKLGKDAGGVLGSFLGGGQQQQAPQAIPAPVPAPASAATTASEATIEPAATETAPEAPPAAGGAQPLTSKQKRALEKQRKEQEQQEAIQGVLKGLLGQ